MQKKKREIKKKSRETLDTNKMKVLRKIVGQKETKQIRGMGGILSMIEWTEKGH